MTVSLKRLGHGPAVDFSAAGAGELRDDLEAAWDRVGREAGGGVLPQFLCLSDGTGIEPHRGHDDAIPVILALGNHGGLGHIVG